MKKLILALICVCCAAFAAASVYGAADRESLSYLYAGTPASYIKIIDAADHALKTISPDYFDIDASGNLLITPADKIDAAFIKEIHNRGIKIVPFISNHWDKPKGNAALDNAEALSGQVAAAVEKHGLDGVNIDIENVNETYRQKYTEFTRLLRQKLPKDKLVSVAVAANPNGWTAGWHGSYDYKALAAYADYLMIMAYDESYYGGPPGPISGSDFFNASIQFAFDQGVPKEKIVAGIPFFGRYWKEGDAVGGNAITAADVEFLLTHYQSEKRYDEAQESANVRLTIKAGELEPKVWGGKTLTAGSYNIWYDDLRAVRYKLSQINSYDLLGAGSWALGQENPGVWQFYTDVLNGRPPEYAAAATQKPTPSPAQRQPSTLGKVLAILNKGNTRRITALNTLTRGEAAVLLSEWTRLAPELSGEPFADTADYWGKGQINALKQRGILHDDRADDRFYPNENIRKDDLAVLLERMLVLPNTINFYAAPLKDVPLTGYGYYEITKLCYFDIMSGPYFQPEMTVTARDLAMLLETIKKHNYPFNPNQHLKVSPRIEIESAAPNPNSEPVIEPK